MSKVKMGIGQSLPLTVGDSIVSPGNPSIISDPITVDYNVFVDELTAVLRYPVPPPMEPLVKEVIVTEKDTPDEFEVKVILDPVKLQALGLANKEDPSLDRTQIHTKVKIDRQNRFAESENYFSYWAGEEPKLMIKTRAEFTKEDPFRLDYYWTTPEGERQANELARGMLQPVVNQIFDLLADRQVVLKLDADKKTAACDPIDDCITTYEPLFDALIYTMKNNPKSTAEDISETEFKTTPGNESTYSVVAFDKDQGNIKIDTFQQTDDEKLMTTVYSFSKDPLTIEVWIEREGKKVTGKSMVKVLQNFVDAAVEKATSDLGLF